MGDLSIVPISYKGRIRPLSVYTHNIFYDFYHGSEADESTKFPGKDPLAIISTLYLDGYEKWKNEPIIWVDKKTKTALLLDPKRKRFSYAELTKAFKENIDAIKIMAHHYHLKNDLRKLDPKLAIQNFIVLEAGKEFPWNQLKKGDNTKSFYNSQLAENLIALLQKLALFESFKGPSKISSELELKDQLEADPHFHLLPGRYRKGEWFGLGALVFNDRNFTLYKDDSFKKIREGFFLWKDHHESKPIAQALLNSYEEIEGKPFLKSASSQSYYPTLFQLRLESAYSAWPIMQTNLVLYLLSLFLLLAFPNSKELTKVGYICFFLAFILQLASLVIRSWILMRPPVSNMFETVIYVPFVGALAAVFLARSTKTEWPIIGSALLSVILLAITEFSHLNRELENVQAVLNSNFWLVIHVLMIVGSYGILILAGVLAHFYLLSHKKSLEQSIVQCLYLGTALLIPGTILGGVWAAQSWGRFWDWDPKESWAFISICTYLILIHLYRFHRISIWGLSIGAIMGLGIISFTWYGVNYILGTGMHTYGFGQGSHTYYFVFLLAESFFLIYMAQKRAKKFLV